MLKEVDDEGLRFSIKNILNDFNMKDPIINVHTVKAFTFNPDPFQARLQLT